MSSLREEGATSEHEEGAFLVTELHCWVGFDYELPGPAEAERPVERGSRNFLVLSVSLEWTSPWRYVQDF